MGKAVSVSTSTNSHALKCSRTTRQKREEKADVLLADTMDKLALLQLHWPTRVRTLKSCSPTNYTPGSKRLA